MAHRYRHWTVLETKQASSKDAAKHIEDQGFPTFRPLYRTQPHPTNHVRFVKQLFERYLFVQVDRRKNWRPLMSTRGVHQLFLTGGQPHEIDDSHVAWLRSQVDELGYFVVHFEEPPVFSERQPVQWQSLSGNVDGIYLGLGRSSRETRRVLFNILGRDAVFEVRARDLVAA
jgi:transcription antitermination factor NusG